MSSLSFVRHIAAVAGPNAAIDVLPAAGKREAFSFALFFYKDHADLCKYGSQDKQMRILLVEDDAMIGEAISQALKDACYAVDWVRDGQAALSTVNNQHYDAMLLDLGLPQKDGLQVLRVLRANKNSMPIVIVSARDAVEDRIQGLDSGADDYILKPFEMTELFARIRATVRRNAGGRSTDSFKWHLVS